MTTFTPTYLFDGVRLPIGRRHGQLADRSAPDLGALAIKKLGKRIPIDAVDGVIMGVTVQAGTGLNPARVAAHRAGLSLSIPAITLNNACLAGIDCMVDSTRRIRGGEAEAILVGGMHSTSQSPQLSWEKKPDDRVLAFQHDGVVCAIGGLHVGADADRRNAELGISRQRQDEWALRSHERAAAADFLSTGEVAPVVAADGSTMTIDESIRSDTSLDALSQLRPAFTPDGTVTAGNAPPLNDGAGAGIVASQQWGETHGLTPLARIVDWAYSAGPDHTLHHHPAVATSGLLDKQGLRTADIDLYEINEAFAGVALAAVDTLGLAHDVVNPRGGSIAIGHPDAATAFRQVLTLAYELRRQGLRRGIATLCGGGGQGIAIMIENAS